MVRTSCPAEARLLGTAAEYYHHQPEAAPLAPRGRWAQSPGAGFVRGPGRASDAACHFEDTQAPLPEPPSPARASTAGTAQKTRTQLQVPHLDPRAPDSASRPGGFPLGWCGDPLASERPDLSLRLGPGSRSPAQSPRAGSAPGGSRFRLRSRRLLLLVTSSLGPREHPQESGSAPRGSVGLAGCAGPWAAASQRA